MNDKKRAHKRKENLKLTLLYTSMSLSVILLVSFITFTLLGYRFNISEGTIERGGLVQFGSTPSGARVSVDGETIGTRTPGKTNIVEGEHSFGITLDGYRPWSKTVNVQSGTLTWLNYALMIPNELPTETISRFDNLHKVLASPDRNSILVHTAASSATLRIYDIRGNSVTAENVAIPTTLYTDAGRAGVKHSFDVRSWSIGGSTVLVKHTYGSSQEWLVVDVHNVRNSKNLSTIFGVNFDNIKFSDSDGNLMYVVTNGVLRRLNLSNETISRQLVSGVREFDSYAGHVVAYVATETKDDITKRVVGVYRDGDDDTYTLQSFVSNSSPHIATAHYFNDDYVAIAYGKNVRVLSGKYPDEKNGIDNLKTFAEFNLDWDISSISFSPSGQYVYMKSDSGKFASYDLEYETLSSADAGGAKAPSWLNNNYLWSVVDGNLVIREFDGNNVSEINQSEAGFDAVLTSNNRYIYSVARDDDGFVLQRVLLVITN